MTTEPLTRLVRHLKQSLDAADLAEWSDAELLVKFRETREPAVLEVIVRRHGPRVLAACRRVLPERADADDAFQATFVLLLRRSTALRNVRKAKGGAEKETQQTQLISDGHAPTPS